MSYRRAWLLLADLNLSFDQPVALTSTGGRGGGGVSLTPLGEKLVAGYRKMESELQPMADVHLKDVQKCVLAVRGPSVAAATVSVNSIRRKVARR